MLFKECSDAQANWAGDDPREVLNIGEIYEVTKVDQHAWHTLYRIKGVKGEFNSVCFDILEE